MTKYFHFYVTGYPYFFNPDTADCSQTTFHYHWAAYNPPSDGPLNRIVYLTKSLRTELNNLVGKLNTVIAGAVKDANPAYVLKQVHFVMTTSFNDGHWW